MDTLLIPSVYAVGYERARQIEPEIADNFILHTTKGDPEADAVIDLLFSMDGDARRRIVRGCMNQDEEVMRDAPELVREFFETLSTPPDWFSYEATQPGIQAFHANSGLILQAFVAGVLVEGFSTGIGKSFVITGRLREQGVQRLKQNNRHVLEIFLPDGLRRYGDGWRLSVRIRLVHAQVRRLLARSEDWDVDSWGTPLSAAHLGLAASAFSARLLKHSQSIGAKFTDEQRQSFMLIWRYSAHLMGVPESMLWTDEEHALRIYATAMICEPPIDFESIIMANSLVNSVPLVIGITDDRKRRSVVKKVFSLSRALIGKEAADQLKFPKHRAWAVLPWMKLQARYDRTLQRVFPGRSSSSRLTNFSQVISAAQYNEEGISYVMPDHLYAERSQWW